MLPIYVYGSSVLREIAKPIAADYPQLDEFLAKMWETMYESDGVGLAAPQVGRSVRIFVIDATPWAEEEPSLADFKRVFINAQITEELGEEEPFSEGCLSVPGINESVNRPSAIRMRYVDENFVEHEEVFEGMAARVIQHEYDHLEGRMFIDHLSPLRKTLLKAKLAKMAKGDYKAAYPTKQVKK